MVINVISIVNTLIIIVASIIIMIIIYVIIRLLLLLLLTSLLSLGLCCCVNITCVAPSLKGIPWHEPVLALHQRSICVELSLSQSHIVHYQTATWQNTITRQRVIMDGRTYHHQKRCEGILPQEKTTSQSKGTHTAASFDLEGCTGEPYHIARHSKPLLKSSIVYMGFDDNCTNYNFRKKLEFKQQPSMFTPLAIYLF